MPTIDFSSIGNVMEYEFTEDTVSSVNSEDDTCVLSANGSALLFYHCEPTSPIRSNGAIEGASGGFSNGDHVIVMKHKTDSSKKYVIGHTDGVKACGIGDIIIEMYLNTYNVRKKFALVWDLKKNAPAQLSGVTFPVDMLVTDPEDPKYAELQKYLAWKTGTKLDVPNGLAMTYFVGGNATYHHSGYFGCNTDKEMPTCDHVWDIDGYDWRDTGELTGTYSWTHYWSQLQRFFEPDRFECVTYPSSEVEESGWHNVSTLMTAFRYPEGVVTWLPTAYHLKIRNLLPEAPPHHPTDMVYMTGETNNERSGWTICEYPNSHNSGGYPDCGKYNSVESTTTHITTKFKLFTPLGQIDEYDITYRSVNLADVCTSDPAVIIEDTTGLFIYDAYSPSSGTCYPTGPLPHQRVNSHLARECYMTEKMFCSIFIAQKREGVFQDSGSGLHAVSYLDREMKIQAQAYYCKEGLGAKDWTTIPRNSTFEAAIESLVNTMYAGERDDVDKVGVISINIRAPKITHSEEELP
jgi:hypothetical protein